MENDKISTDLQVFNPIDAAIAEIGEKYNKLEIKGIEDKDGYKTVHAARMIIKSTRVDIEKTRKSLKDAALKYGKAVDTRAKELTEKIEPIETSLKAKEDFIDAEKQRIKEEKEKEAEESLNLRINSLSAYGIAIDIRLLKIMPEEEYNKELQSAKLKYEESQAIQLAAEEYEKLRWSRADEIKPYYEYFNDNGDIQLADLSNDEFVNLLTELKKKKEISEKAKAVEAEKLEAQRIEQEQKEKLLADAQIKIEEDRAAIDAEKAVIKEEKVAIEETQIKQENPKTETGSLRSSGNVHFNNKEKLLKVVHDLESYVYPDVKGALANEILDIFMNDIAIVINHYSEAIKKL